MRTQSRHDWIKEHLFRAFFSVVGWPSRTSRMDESRDTWNVVEAPAGVWLMGRELTEPHHHNNLKLARCGERLSGLV